METLEKAEQTAESVAETVSTDTAEVTEQVESEADLQAKKEAEEKSKEEREQARKGFRTRRSAKRIKSENEQLKAEVERLRKEKEEIAKKANAAIDGALDSVVANDYDVDEARAKAERIEAQQEANLDPVFKRTPELDEFVDDSEFELREQDPEAKVAFDQFNDIGIPTPLVNLMENVAKDNNLDIAKIKHTLGTLEGHAEKFEDGMESIAFKSPQKLLTTLKRAEKAYKPPSKDESKPYVPPVERKPSGKIETHAERVQKAREIWIKNPTQANYAKLSAAKKKDE